MVTKAKATPAAVRTKAKAKAPPAKAKPRPAKAKAVKAKAKARPAKAELVKAKAKPTSAKAKLVKAKARPTPAQAKPTPAQATPAKVTKATAPARPPIIGIPSPAAARARLLVDGQRFGAATLALQPLEPLRLTSGVVVACDPLEVHGPAFGRRLEPGSYDVIAAVATYPEKHGPGEQLVAAVFVKIAATTPVRWEPAAFADEPDGIDPAYATDSGAGCFMDARLQAALAAEPSTFPTASFRALERQLLDEHHVATWGWATYQPEATAPATCVAFLGGGTSVRRSYWGLDERGAVACLLTDLETFPADAWV